MSERSASSVESMRMQEERKVDTTCMFLHPTRARRLDQTKLQAKFFFNRMSDLNVEEPGKIGSHCVPTSSWSAN